MQVNASIAAERANCIGAVLRAPSLRGEVNTAVNAMLPLAEPLYAVSALPRQPVSLAYC
jgi:hypothetical protein